MPRKRRIEIAGYYHVLSFPLSKWECIETQQLAKTFNLTYDDTLRYDVDGS